MPRCPQDHVSESNDFCSVCGMEMTREAAAQPAPSGPGVVEVAPITCPSCGAVPEARQFIYCEVCGYNFRTKQAGIPPLPAPPEPTPSAPSQPASSPPRSAGAQGAGGPPAASLGQGASPDAHQAAIRWQIRVQTSASTVDETGVPLPVAATAHPPQTFPLFEADSLIGRATPGVRLQVPIYHDVGVSRRHAMLLRGADGSLRVRDLSSANGTTLNEESLLPGVDRVLKDGDVLGIGAATRITVQEVRS